MTANKKLVLNSVCVIAALLTALCPSHAAEPLGREEAILELVTPRMKHRPRLPYSGKFLRAYKSDEYRGRLVKAFEAAGEKFDIPPNLLIAMAYRETVFRPELIGSRNEMGIIQTGNQARYVCRKHCHGIDTPEGGAMCGACWLDRARKRCKDLVGALYSYACGRCFSNDKNVLKAVQNRIWLWNYLNELTGETNRKLASISDIQGKNDTQGVIDQKK